MLNVLLPHLAAVRVHELSHDDGVVRIRARASSEEATCPACGNPSSRVHCPYERQLADTPVAGRQLMIRLHVRKFICQTLGCARRHSARRSGAQLSTDGQHAPRRLMQYADLMKSLVKPIFPVFCSVSTYRACAARKHRRPRRIAPTTSRWPGGIEQWPGDCARFEARLESRLSCPLVLRPSMPWPGQALVVGPGQAEPLGQGMISGEQAMAKSASSPRPVPDLGDDRVFAPTG